MRRKTFIYLTVAGAAALATPAAACRQYSDALLNTLGTPDFLAQLCDAKTIGDIGSAYRATIPAESRRSDVIGLLLKEVQSTQDASRLPQQHQDKVEEDPRLSQFLQHRVTLDFATGDVVTIKGWVLSRTEARQCAIYSFNHS